MEEVTFPTPPEGFEYKLVAKVKTKKPRVMDKDPSELTPRQLATLKYREKNKEKLKEQNRLRYQEKKSVVTSGQE
jgi:hypothetical protein